MAKVGRNSKPDAVKGAVGNPSGRPLSDERENMRTEPLIPPGGRENMRERALRYWDEFITPAWWLTQDDSQKAFMWCNLAADFEADPTGCSMSKVNSCRHLGSELGFDPGSRASLIGSQSAKNKSGQKKDRFFSKAA